MIRDIMYLCNDFLLKCLTAACKRVLNNVDLSLHGFFSPLSSQAVKWVPNISKAELRACLRYSASCSGISLGD